MSIFGIIKIAWLALKLDSCLLEKDWLNGTKFADKLDKYLEEVGDVKKAYIFEIFIKMSLVYIGSNRLDCAKKYVTISQSLIKSNDTISKSDAEYLQTYCNTIMRDISGDLEKVVLMVDISKVDDRLVREFPMSGVIGGLGITVKNYGDSTIFFT